MKKILQTMLRSVGYEIHRTQLARSEFVPFVRRFAFMGSDFDFWIANPDAKGWYNEEDCKKEGEFKELKRLIKSGDRVLEVGSHHGLTGIVCANYAGSSGAVLGLEAHPLNALIAQAQIGLNPSIQNLRFINAAGADHEGTVRISVWHNSSVIINEETYVEVPTRMGDRLDSEYGPFSVLKIDVEGFETAVLKGCKELLWRRPRLAIEVHIDALAKYGSSVAEVFDLIDIAHYEGTIIIRPDYITVRQFDRTEMPAAGIVNLFLSPH